MSAFICEQRDGYLGLWLSAPERAAFEAHLASCPACRQAVQEQAHLDRLLTRAVAQLEPVPAGLIDRLDQRLRQVSRRRRRAWGAGLAAAVVLAVGLALWAWKPPAAIDELPQAPVVEQVPRPELELPPAKAEVTFAPASPVIAVPVPSSDPAVTIVWVYPAVLPDRGAPDSTLKPERSDR